jgi:DNA polymerase I
MMGRRRKLKDINSPNIEKRGHHERCSVNTRVQGSAAEVVKRAMLRVRLRS